MDDLPAISRQELRHQPIEAVMTRDVYAVAPDKPLLELTSEMRGRRISCVVVVDAERRPIGIISERDVVRILCETDRPAASLCAGDVMSSPVQTIAPGMLCPDVMQSMRERQFRRFPVADADGRLVGLVTQTDLIRASERDLAQYSARLEQAIARKTEQLAKLSRLKDDLMGMIVHDLKNPLAVILGVLDAAVLSRRAVEDPKLRRRLSLALEASRAMLRMVLNLLDITKIEAGELKPERAMVPCHELIERAVHSMIELAERDGLRIEVTRVERERNLFVDASLLERVLQNLLSNAIKFSPSGERIEVAAWAEVQGLPPSVCISVSNLGKPIPVEYHQKIFDKFAQIEAKESGNIASTGLGLAFCKLALEAHAGNIRVESPLEDGRGARFVCMLPLE